MDDGTDSEKMQSLLTVLQNADVDNFSSNSSTFLEKSSGLTKENKRKRHVPECPIKAAGDIDKKQKLEIVENALVQNELMYDILDKLESSLMKYILECKKEQILINRKISEMKTPGSKIRRECSYLFKGKALLLHRVNTSPYFKDVNGYGSLPNEDVQKRKMLGYLNIFDMIKTSPWSNEQKRTLEKAILTITLERKEMLNKDSSMGHLKTMDSQTVKQCLIEEIGDKVEECDWLKVSAYYLQGVRSAHECRAVWFNYLHPKFKKTPWSEQEGNQLSVIVKQNDYENWDKIAEELGTARSAFQCLGYYSIKLCDSSSVPWTPIEFENLKTIVERIRYGHYVNWAKVAYFMDGRSAMELYRKWQKLFSDLKRGKFSKEEDMLLVVGLRKFGPKWSEIAEFLPNRNSMQIRGRIVVLKGRELAKKPWTPEDDDLLDELTEKYGYGNWSKISLHFLHRTPPQVRARYLSVQKQRENEHAGANIRPVGQYPRDKKERRSLGELWETAVNLLEKRNVKKSLKGYEHHDAAVMDELSKVLKNNQKRGRKAGQVNDSSLQKLFYDFFFMSYGQQGGRGKEKCSPHMIPTLAYHLIVALQLLDAKINLPWEVDSILEENVFPEIDIDIADYLILRKELMGKYKLIHFTKPGDRGLCKLRSSLLQTYEMRKRNSTTISKNNVYVPPNHANLIGLRSMLLNLKNLKAQKVGKIVKKNSSDADSSKASTSTSFEVPSSASSLPVVSSSIPSTSNLLPTSHVLPLTYSLTSRVPVQSSLAYKPTIIATQPSSIVLNKIVLDKFNTIASTCRSPEESPSVVTITSISSVPNTYSAPTPKEMYNNAAALFRHRIKRLFLWSGLVSTSYPAEKEQTPIVFRNKTPEKVLKKPGRKKKRKRKATINRGSGEASEAGSATEITQKPKRSYVKSGKYVVCPKSSETLRKSSRISEMNPSQ